METPFFFPRGSYELFGVMHEPEASARRTPFVFCHPFGEEKLWAHRVLVSFARELAQRGHPVLRFDHMGHGDSDGESSDASIDSALADIGGAIDWLKRKTSAPTVGLLGLRLGATLAAHLANGRDDVASLVLWAPIVDGGRYVQELLRLNLTTQMAVYREIREDREALAQSLRQGQLVNIDGYDVSLPFYEQITDLTLNHQMAFPGPCLIVQVAPQEVARPAEELEVLRQQYTTATLVTAQDHPFWKEIDFFYHTAPALYARTCQWLEHQ